MLSAPREDGSIAERPVEMTTLLGKLDSRHILTYLRMMKRAYTRMPIAKVAAAVGVVMNSSGNIPETYFGKAVTNSIKAAILNANQPH